MRLKIISKAVGEAYAELTNENPLTVDAIWSKLPIEGKANTWGDEIYFPIPVQVGAENQSEVVQMGDLAYWPPGNALCIFFGPTPASWDKEIRPASPVNVIGRIVDNPRLFKLVSPGDKIRLERT
ncbi:cyclophilin-like fold protein [Candidatus Bathyarchaeota archaeon]|nr:cyclophilin-like fold protein [Candidatus Bathyarchaeota archaeon]